MRAKKRRPSLRTKHERRSKVWFEDSVAFFPSEVPALFQVPDFATLTTFTFTQNVFWVTVVAALAAPEVVNHLSPRFPPARLTERMQTRVFQKPNLTHMAEPFSDYLIFFIVEGHLLELFMDLAPAVLLPFLSLQRDQFFADHLAELGREGLDGDVQA